MIDSQSPEVQKTPIPNSLKKNNYTKKELDHKNAPAIKKHFRRSLVAKITGGLGLRRDIEDTAINSELSRALQEQQLKHVDEDIQASQEAREKAEGIARIDSLTQLPNRLWFEEQAEREIAHYTRTGRQFTLLAFDIDDFKRINDEYGHAVGDRILQAVARLHHRIEEPLARVDDPQKGPNENRARMGQKGDEFVEMLLDTSDPELITEVMTRYAEEFRELSRQILAEEQRELKLDPNQVIRETTLSMGASVVKPGDTVASLLKKADEALYLTKRVEGKGHNIAHIILDKDGQDQQLPVGLDRKATYYKSLKPEETEFLDTFFGTVKRVMQQEELSGSFFAVGSTVRNPGKGNDIDISMYIDKETEGEGYLERTQIRFREYNRIIQKALALIPEEKRPDITYDEPIPGRGSVQLVNDGIFHIRSKDPNVRPIDIKCEPEREYAQSYLGRAVRLADVA